MEPTIAPSGATLGATVTDLDLSDMASATRKAVEEAFLEQALLTFSRGRG